MESDPRERERCQVWECRWNEGSGCPDLSWLLRLSQIGTRVPAEAEIQGGNVMVDTTRVKRRDKSCL